MKYSQFLTAAMFAVLLVLSGCSKDEAEEYEQKVDLTEAQKAKIETDGASQPVPGTVNPGSGESTPGALTVPGKGGN